MVLCIWLRATDLGFPRCLSVKESTGQRRSHRRRRFNPWVGKIPWRRKSQPTQVFLPGYSHGQRSLAGYSPRGGRVGHDRAHTHMMTTDLGVFKNCFDKSEIKYFYLREALCNLSYL